MPVCTEGHLRSTSIHQLSRMTCTVLERRKKGFLKKYLIIINLNAQKKSSIIVTIHYIIIFIISIIINSLYHYIHYINYYQFIISLYQYCAIELILYIFVNTVFSPYTFSFCQKHWLCLIAIIVSYLIIGQTTKRRQIKGHVHRWQIWFHYRLNKKRTTGQITFYVTPFMSHEHDLYRFYQIFLFINSMYGVKVTFLRLDIAVGNVFL
jgi:hypothetical protein